MPWPAPIDRFAVLRFSMPSCWEFSVEFFWEKVRRSFGVEARTLLIMAFLLLALDRSEVSIYALP